MDRSIYRYSDDGEPSSTAGKPIYGQILSNNLTNTCIIVIRYFGGTKLGVGGLINAYKEAALNAIKNASIVKKYISKYFLLEFSYESTSSVLNLLKKHNIEILNKSYQETCKLELCVRETDAQAIENSLKKISNLELTYLYTA